MKAPNWEEVGIFLSPPCILGTPGPCRQLCLFLITKDLSTLQFPGRLAAGVATEPVLPWKWLLRLQQGNCPDARIGEALV